ncbi:E3 ubiquitin-protein transferase rmnd5a [Homalodisca vitripennis]|nr:E3 ubiquitin-protein transferase rmnd5a [Homalodisca vitripennis]
MDNNLGSNQIRDVLDDEISDLEDTSDIDVPELDSDVSLEDYSSGSEIVHDLVNSQDNIPQRIQPGPGGDTGHKIDHLEGSRLRLCAVCGPTTSKISRYWCPQCNANFVSDFASTSREDVFSGPEKIMLLNQVICQHFYRQGMLDIAQELAQDAGLKTEEDVKEPFTELNRILDSLKQKDLGPALEWAAAHREALEAQTTCLSEDVHHCLPPSMRALPHCHFWSNLWRKWSMECWGPLGWMVVLHLRTAKDTRIMWPLPCLSVKYSVLRIYQSAPWSCVC